MEICHLNTACAARKPQVYIRYIPFVWPVKQLSILLVNSGYNTSKAGHWGVGVALCRKGGACWCQRILTRITAKSPRVVTPPDSQLWFCSRFSVINNATQLPSETIKVGRVPPKSGQLTLMHQGPRFWLSLDYRCLPYLVKQFTRLCAATLKKSITKLLKWSSHSPAH